MTFLGRSGNLYYSEEHPVFIVLKRTTDIGLQLDDSQYVRTPEKLLHEDKGATIAKFHLRKERKDRTSDVSQNLSVVIIVMIYVQSRVCLSPWICCE